MRDKTKQREHDNYVKITGKTLSFKCDTPKSSTADTIHNIPSLRTLGFLCSFMIL